MNYPNVLPQLLKHDKIIVTGPQRSGTRIAAKMIAHDKRCLYVDEDDIGTYNFGKAREALKLEDDVVVQCPGLSAGCHRFPPNVMVVFMHREVSRIRASEKRIGWGPWEENEWIMYNDIGFKPICAPISVYKYYIWNRHQKGLIKTYIELNYRSLEKHDLWIPKGLRVGFRAKQTDLNEGG